MLFKITNLFSKENIRNHQFQDFYFMELVTIIQQKYIKEVCFKTNLIILFLVDEGFDMRLASNGLWGFGTYFSDSSLYSHDYAYKVNFKI